MTPSPSSITSPFRNDSLNRLFRVVIVVGTLALIAVSVPDWLPFRYPAKLRKQTALLEQVRALEKDLDAFPGGEEKLPEKEDLVRRLLAAETQLLRLRKRLEPSDRTEVYREPLGAEVHQVVSELGKRDFIVPESFVASVRDEIAAFVEPDNRGTLERCFARKPRFEKLIHQELDRMKLPPDFLYIAMQESLLDSGAQSGNDARGLWQMVPETARNVGLRVPEDWKTAPPEQDERTRPKPATRAAAKYLRALYSDFGDAALCLTAYNAGEGKLRKTLRRIEDQDSHRDYWYIYRMGMMSPETREYVPKIIAMILIDRNRPRYGFTPDKAAPGQALR
ncbi:MAG: lytic transglycosylase domain-containing protein [Fibrobacteria bacterium]